MAPPWVENAKEIKNRKKELKEHRNLRIPMQFRKPPIYNDDEESDDEEPYEAIWPTTDEEKLKEFSPLTEHLNTVANEQSTDESSPGDDDEEGISTSHPNHMQITGKCRQPELKSCRRELQAFNRFHKLRKRSGIGATTSAINDSPVESGFSSTAEFLDNVKMVVNEENLSLEDKIDRKTFYSHLREAVEQFSASKKRALIEVQCNPSDQAVHNSLKNASMSLTARYSSEFLISLFKSPPQFGENLKPFVIVAPWIHSILAFWIRNDIDDMAWISANTAPDPENKVIVLVKEESGEISIISGKTTTLDVKLAQFKDQLPTLYQWPKTVEDPLKIGQRHCVIQEGKMKPGLLTKFVNDLSDAVYRMSDAHIGALIIIDDLRDPGSLDDVVGHSIVLDTVFHPELLVSIFNTESPLHDKAVILRFYPNSGLVTIHSARGYLRPASNDEVAQVFPTKVGTRHSAALGASQITKCPIVVVSEETGTVSICQREQKKVIKTGVKKQEFMDTLKKILLN